MGASTDGDMGRSYLIYQRISSSFLSRVTSVKSLVEIFVSEVFADLKIPLQQHRQSTESQLHKNVITTICLLL